MPCAFEFKVYPVILRNKIHEGVNKHETESFRDLNVIRQIGIAAQAFAYTGKAMIEDLRAVGQELKNNAEYTVLAEFSLDQDNRFVFTNGIYKGNHLIDFDRRVKELTPNLYDAQIAATNRLAEEAFQFGSSIVAVPYYREGEDNRDIIVMQLDRKTNKGKYLVINTAPSGNRHSFSEIKRIAKEKFTNLNKNSPTDRIFLLTDKVIPEDRIAKTIEEFNIKENGLEIKETQMRLDTTSGKVYAKESGKEIDIENLAQKRRLVGKIKSCHACAVETGKTEAFFYAPDNLGNNKKEREISQILVDQEGNVTFKTAVLSSELTNSDLKHLLLELGYVGQKTPHEFSYTDDPVSDAEMKKIIKEELVFLQNRGGVERFDLFGERLNLDRILTNNTFLYFHDVVIAREMTIVEGEVETKEQIKISKEKVDSAERTIIAGQESKMERKTIRNISRENIKVSNRDAEFEEQNKRKKSKCQQGFHDNNGVGSQSTVRIAFPKTYLEEEEDVSNHQDIVYRIKDEIIWVAVDKKMKTQIVTEKNDDQECEQIVLQSLVVTRVDMQDYQHQDEIVMDDSISVQENEIRTDDFRPVYYHDSRPPAFPALAGCGQVDHDRKRGGKMRDIQRQVKIPDDIKLDNNIQQDEDGEYLQIPLLTFVTPPKIIFDRNIGIRFKNLPEVEAQRIWEMFFIIYANFLKRQDFPEISFYNWIQAKQEINQPVQTLTNFQFDEYARLLAIMLICVVNLLFKN